MANLSSLAGYYYLERAKRLRRVPPDQAGSEPIRTLIDLFLNSRFDSKLSLSVQQGNMGTYLGGQVSCRQNTHSFKIYANKLTPDSDLEGVIYAYGDEIVFAATTDERQIRMELYAEGPNGQNGFYTYQFLWLRSLSQEPAPATKDIGQQLLPLKTTSNNTPYPLDNRLIGHWRFEEHMSSGGFSYYREINMILAANGRFIRTKQSFASLTHYNQYGDWRGITTANHLPEDERGTWGIVNGRLYLYFDNDMYMDCAYNMDGQAMFCYYESGRQYWEKMN